MSHMPPRPRPGVSAAGSRLRRCAQRHRPSLALRCAIIIRRADHDRLAAESPPSSRKRPIAAASEARSFCCWLQTPRCAQRHRPRLDDARCAIIQRRADHDRLPVRSPPRSRTRQLPPRPRPGASAAGSRLHRCAQRHRPSLARCPLRHHQQRADHDRLTADRHRTAEMSLAAASEATSFCCWVKIGSIVTGQTASRSSTSSQTSPSPPSILTAIRASSSRPPASFTTRWSYRSSRCPASSLNSSA